MAPEQALAVFVLAAVASFTQALSGFGFSLLIVPPLALVLGAREAVVVANGLSLLVNTSITAYLRRFVQWPLWFALTVASCIGMPLGLAVLLALSPRALQVLIAVAVLAATFLTWRGLRLHRGGRGADFVAGFLSGVLNTSTSMSGPPVVLHLHARGLTPEQFRATLTAYFAVGACVALLLYLAGGQLHRETGLGILAGAPGLLAGWSAGNVLFRRLDPARFRGIVLAVLMASAVVALVAAARG